MAGPSVTPDLKTLPNKAQYNDLYEFEQKLGKNESRALKVRIDPRGNFTVHKVQNSRFSKKNTEDRVNQTRTARVTFSDALERALDGALPDGLRDEIINNTNPLTVGEVRDFVEAAKLSAAPVEDVTLDQGERFAKPDFEAEGRLAETFKRINAERWVQKFDFETNNLPNGWMKSILADSPIINKMVVGRLNAYFEDYGNEIPNLLENYFRNDIENAIRHASNEIIDARMRGEQLDIPEPPENKLNWDYQIYLENYRAPAYIQTEEISELTLQILNEAPIFGDLEELAARLDLAHLTEKVYIDTLMTFLKMNRSTEQVNVNELVGVANAENSNLINTQPTETDNFDHFIQTPAVADFASFLLSNLPVMIKLRIEKDEQSWEYNTSSDEDISTSVEDHELDRILMREEEPHFEFDDPFIGRFISDFGEVLKEAETKGIDTPTLLFALAQKLLDEADLIYGYILNSRQRNPEFAWNRTEAYLDLATEGLRKIAENYPQNANVVTACETIAELVEDRSHEEPIEGLTRGDILEIFNEMRQEVSRPEAEQYACATRRIPGEDTIVPFVDFYTDKTIEELTTQFYREQVDADAHLLNYFSISNFYLKISEIKDLLWKASYVFDEEGILRDAPKQLSEKNIRSALDKNDYLNNFKENTINNNIAEGYSEIESAKLFDDKYLYIYNPKSITEGLVNRIDRFLCDPEGDIHNIVSSGRNIISSVNPNTRDPKVNLRAEIDKIRGNDLDDSDPGYGRRIADQLNRFGEAAAAAADIFTDQSFLKKLKGHDRRVMEAYGKELVELRDMFERDQGPVASLRRMAEMAAEDPIRFAASLSARQNGYI